ncbi:lytic transglycosylase domain-containing protein [Anaeromyxobacter oryzisoli]|uniref:lytic transglycosylase domain-containing protein n=1 Tax=Anaeromyxobacter oryzisoli TaxID=2925408 RepID=UPI001F5AC27B|nr:lytic transglycosylase domain-containing protein [Anaeromyxobacter sp. SG63]
MLTLLLLLSSGALAPDGLYDRQISQAIEDVKAVHPVPAALVKAVIARESSWNPRAASRAGALGLMQLLPMTAAKVGVSREELFDPAKNILAGVRLLAVLLRHYRGDVISALVAYNARPRQLFAPIPRNGETPEYVKAVLAYYARYSERGGPIAPPGLAPAVGDTSGSSPLLRSTKLEP